MNDFNKRAQLLGIDPNKAYSGKLSVKNLDRLKEILTVSGMVPDHARLTQDITVDTEDTTQRVADAVSRHVYSGAALSDADRALAETAFPLELNVVSAPDKTINSAWNLNDIATQGPILVSLGTLTIEDGGYIVVSNRALDFTVDTLVCSGSNPLPSDLGIVNILGEDGAQGQRGSTPAAPGQATNGNPGNCSSAGIAGAAGGNGKTGEIGGTGGTGGTGGNGRPSLPATLRVTSAVRSASSLTLVTRSGAGGKGGTGGTGSAGGRGGDGGAGATCGCTGSAGGSGAQGGRGGTGGNGGQGGNGTDAGGNITIFIPSAAAQLFVPIRQSAQPGTGGDAGVGGPGGAGGGGGGAGKHNSGGTSGGTGGQGEAGQPGTAGTIVGKPADILIQPT